MNNQLPKDWKWMKLGEVCDKIVDGSHNPPKAKDSGMPMLSAKDIFNNKIYFDKPRWISEEEFLRENKRTNINPGDILLTIVATIGRTAVVPIKAQKFTLQRSVAVLKTNQNPYFFCYAFQTSKFQQQLRDVAKGTAQKGVYLKTLSQLEIPLPPKLTQQAIVSKIEELFSELDKGIENLRLAQQQLKTYRQSVLKWAFETIDTENTVEEITESSLIGLVKSSKEQNVNGDGVPYIKMNNIDINGNVNFSQLVYVGASKSEIDKFQLQKGDILINTRNSFELVGKTGIVREEKTNAVFNNNLLRLRVKNNVLPLFIGYQLINPSLKGQMLKEKKATTNICALYQRDIFPLRVKICGFEDQIKIVQDIERRLSVADKMEESIHKSLQKAETLRQSILEKAFDGRLVSKKICINNY